MALVLTKKQQIVALSLNCLSNDTDFAHPICHTYLDENVWYHLRVQVLFICLKGNIFKYTQELSG